MAGLPVIKQPSLLVGTMNTYGIGTPDVAIAIGTQAEADHLFGQGSELSRMFVSFFLNNFANEVWALPLKEPTGGVAAAGDIVITAPPTEAGTIWLYVSGELVEEINVMTTDTVGDIAIAIADQINAQGDLPVTADASTTPGTCTLTAKWKGVGGNDISVILNYYGSIGGEVTPPGLGITLPQQTPPTTATGTGTATGNSLAVTGVTGSIVIGSQVTGTGIPSTPPTTILNQQTGTPGGDGTYTTSQVTTANNAAVTFTPPLPAINYLYGGTGVPDPTAGISGISTKDFEYVALPFTESNFLFQWGQEYGFTDDGRWGWKRQQFGHLFSCKKDTYSNLITWGQTLNNGVLSVMAFEPENPSPVYESVAAYTAMAQRALINDPARPLQTLSLNGIKLAPLPDRFNVDELNSLALNGIATQKAGSDNQPMISRETTTYQLDLYGFPDDAYELVTTLATLARLIRNQRQAITTKFPRCKLADDGTRFGPGQAIVTPGIVKAELIAEYRIDMFNGLVENIEAYKANLLVERDPNDPNRLNVLYPPDLINQLRIFAVLAQFRLQYDRGLDTQVIGPNIGFTGILPSAP